MNPASSDGMDMTFSVTDVSPTPAPTPMPTQRLVGVYAVQNMLGMTDIQYNTNKESFLQVLQSKIAMACGVPLENVELLNVVDNKSVGGVDVGYYVSAPMSSIDYIKSILQSAQTTSNLVTGLSAVGFSGVTVLQKAECIDATPTSTPSMMPTRSYNILKVLQKIDGVTLDEAENPLFSESILKSVSQVTDIPVDSLVMNSIKEKVGGGIDYLFTIYATNKDVIALTGLVKAKTTTGDAVAGSLKSLGFANAYATTDAIVWDLTPI